MTLQNIYTKIAFYPQAISNDIVIQEAKDEILIYNLRTNKAACLNETSKLVFNLSDGTNSVDEIIKLMQKKLRKPIQEELVWLALDQLADENLLVNSNNLKTQFNGLSRREIIKRAGMASMIALPMISAIVAPPSVAALSSGIPATAACDSDCSVIGGINCACAGPATCGPNALVSGFVGLGVCASASLAIGTGLSGGVNANVCILLNVCISR